MPRRRPVALLFTLLFAFQLLLAGETARVRWEHSRDDASGETSSMAGMPMPGMTTMAERQPASPEPPCDHPASSEQQCQTMAPCAASFLAPDCATTPTVDSEPSAVVAALVIMPPSASLPPALRPPRA